jgi:hypothetical protein
MMTMKAKNIIVVIGLVLGLAACKKGNDYPIVGKWQQVKLRTYNQSYSGVISNDTTFERSRFDSTNYAQFNNGGTAIIGLFYPYPLYDLNIAANVATVKFNYIRVGSRYVMTIPTTTTNPGGFITADTASLSGNDVLIRSTFDNHQFYNIAEAYYSK